MALTQISTAGVKDDAVTAGKIPADAIGSSEIAANAVGSSELADNAVDTAAIADDAVTSAKIANNTITSANIADNAITTDAIANGNITNVKLNSNSVDSNELVASSVTTAKIADEAVTLAKLEHGTSSNNGKFLRANNGADPSFETITGTTINNNADNRVITGSGTANTLEGESNLIFDGSSLGIRTTPSQPFHINQAGTSTTMRIENANADFLIQAGSAGAGGLHLYDFDNSAYRVVLTNAGNVGIGTASPTDKLDLHGTANLRSNTYIGGNLYMYGNSYGDGIFLGGSTSPNLLNDYEEGTFTPSLGYGTTQNNPTHSTQAGKYTKIGNVVTFQARVDISNKGSGSGNVKVGGLPFGASTSPIGNQMVSASAVVGMDVGGDREIFVQFEGSNSTTVFFYQFAIESSVNYGSVDQSKIDNNMQLNIRGTYFTS